MRLSDCAHPLLGLSILLLVLNGCGMRGPLYLPQDPVKPDQTATGKEPREVLP